MILQWILHLIPTTVFLAATVMPSLSEAATAIVNAPEGGEPTEPSETSVEVEETDDSVDPESSEPTEPVQPEQKTEEKIDWRTIPPQVKAHIQSIQKTDPKLANMLQNAVYTSNSFLKEVPGGIKEIRQLKQSIDEFGGLDEIKNISQTYRGLVDEQESMDNMARQGNPEILDNLIEVSGVEGFSKLMGPALARWASSDQAGYTHEMSKVVVSALREGGVVADLNLAFKMLKLNTPEATKEALDCLNRCAEWANEINKVAITAPQRPTVDPKIAEEQQKINDQKTQLFNQEFSGNFRTWRAKEINRLVAEETKGRQLNDYQLNTLHERIIDDVKKILMEDKDYLKNLDRVYNSRNMDELMKFATARSSKLLPEVTKKAYRALFPGVTPKKAAATTQPNGKNTSVKTNSTTASTTTGWVKIDASKAPKPEEIDSKKTTFEMKFKKQAIKKDGTKVYWGNHAPK